MVLELWTDGWEWLGDEFGWFRTALIGCAVGLLDWTLCSVSVLNDESVCG